MVKHDLQIHLLRRKTEIKTQVEFEAEVDWLLSTIYEKIKQSNVLQSTRSDVLRYLTG